MPYKGYKCTNITQMATKTATTTALILATFALVGLLTTGAAVPSAFAQAVDENGSSETGFLDDLLGLDDGNGGTEETETETETTEQSGDQSETNVQTNQIDQDQTAAINEEIGSGEGSEVSSDAESDAESTTKTKSKSGSTPIPGTSTSDSSATSDVSNTGTIGQNQELNDATQVNSNEFGGDESRAAVVGFDFEFEQSVEEELNLVEPEPTPVDNNGPTALLDGLL
jgi:hypothetical protein